MALRKLTMDEVTVKLRTEPEEVPVRGNALASGDDALDRKVEDDIIADLEGGNEWAWCCAVVEVSWGTFKDVAHIGCCSYKSEEDFRAGGYYDDMVAEALDGLNAGIAQILAEISPLLTDGGSAIDEIVEALYPGGDPGHEHGADELGEIAGILSRHGLSP